ncbi:uncharacterized protein LOC123919514 [Trifolium pratense]|uniref:Uncharacterized protein n=1 Tax=Trifolium pratense TaxID=57577 RepID=A0ACB0KHM9_TRIPR|nr:uncharacterized protein LOC123919514 [Trifolium pratense]CAJ2655839.1 unnamed protein product [Trifolium pratense]
MEEKNKQKITASSLCSELFGSKESHLSSSQIFFDSIFSTQSPKISGTESVQSEVNEKTKNETLNSKSDSQAPNTKSKEMSWMYEDQQIQPCSLSSSIYYGGQDIYPPPQKQNYAFNSYKSSGGKDDSQIATRNWWEGSYEY